MKRIVLVIAASAALVAPQQTAGARVTLNTIEPTATLLKGGTRAQVGVVLGCDTIQRAQLRVSVTQSPQAAYAEGKRGVLCTTATKVFDVVAQLQRRNRLVPGPATACVLALSDDDAKQWCKDIQLVG